MRVRTVVVSMFASLAIKTIFASGAFPNSVFGLKLSAKAAAVGKGEGAIGAASGCFFVVVLRHSVPPETVITSVFYGCGQGDSTSAYGFWTIVIRNEGIVIEVWVNP